MGTALIAGIVGFVAYPVLVQIICPVLYKALKKTTGKW